MVSCLQRDMTSAEDLAAARTAIELCNSKELKKEVLCASESEYNSCRSRDFNSCNAKLWKEIIENNATTIMKNLGLPRALLEKVRSLVVLIGRRMLRWAKHHEGILNLSREYSVKFVNSSFFTPLGIIDNKKAAGELMKDTSLSIKQKYTVACLYCFTEHIPDLFKQMSQEEKENIGKDIKYSKIVTFWTDYLNGEIDKLRREKTLNQYMLEKAIESGSKATVEYCLEEKRLSRRKNAVIDAAMETVRKIPEINYEWELFTSYFFERIPIDDFVDLLLFLLSRTSQVQKIEFLKKDIEYSQIIFPDHPHLRILESFLDWPYQNYFMKTANLMWDFLPERTYVDLLLKICFIINPSDNDLKNGVEKSYDYKKLLKEFWIQSPDRYKRYVFSDTVKTYWHGESGVFCEVVRLLIVKLFILKNDTYEDREIFELIIDSATEEEKASIISSTDGKAICIGLMEGERWEMLDEFISKCISSEGEASEFKRRLSFTEEARVVCVHFIKHKWDAAEFFIKWSSLSGEEAMQLKKEIIWSEHGKKGCLHLFLHKSGEIANRFCEWCFTSEDEIRTFKKELIFSVAVDSIADLIIQDKLEVVDEFINWSHLFQEEIIEFKKHLQQAKGNYICENLISGEESWSVSLTIQFEGGKWEQVEKFLTWCFSSEEEIRDFKRNRILNMSGTEIHFRLITSNQWEAAATFFAWLGLSSEEVKELKKETLFNHERAKLMFWILIYRRRDNEIFSDFGSREEGIELLLRWYLTDQATVLEFRDHFKQKYERKDMNEEVRSLLKDFDSAIEQRLSDVDEEQRRTGRKSELNKDLREVEHKKK